MEKELGTWLRRQREDRGLSQEEAARKLGWQPSKLCRYERGVKPIGQQELDTIIGKLRFDRKSMPNDTKSAAPTETAVLQVDLRILRAAGLEPSDVGDQPQSDSARAPRG